MFSSNKSVFKLKTYYVLRNISQSLKNNKSVAGFNSVSNQHKATRVRENEPKEKHSKTRTKSEDNIVDLARDMGGSAAEIAKTGMVGALETGLMLGDMAKQTMDGMWDLAKKTVETVRDSISTDEEPHHHQHRSDDVMLKTSSDDPNRSSNSKKQNVDNVLVDHSGGNKKKNRLKDESKADDKHVDLI